MKKLIISTILLLGLSMNVSAQKRPPLPPQPPKSELINHKMQELDKRYNTEKKLIMNHPLLSKKMKKAQLQTLNERYQSEKRLLKKMR